MPASTKTCTRLADLTSPALIKPPYIENGRLKWEANSAGELIKMFAAGGYDVVRDRGTSRMVFDQHGNMVASLLWHHTVPNFAYAYTSAV